MLSGGVDYEATHRISIGLGAAYFVPDQVATLGGQLRLTLASGWARVCGAAFGYRDLVRLKLCAWPMAGALGGRGVQYQESRLQTDFWLALGGGITVKGVFGSSVGWWIHALAETPLLLQGFSVQTTARSIEVFQTPRIGSVLLLGISVAL